MNDGFKQRLIGAVVLVCLVLILWPLLFSDARGPIVDQRSQIPAAPAFEKYTVDEPVRPQAKSRPLLSAEPEPIAEEAVPKKPALDAALDDDGLPVSWVLQVASFTKAENANELKNTLQKQGYKAYTRPIKTKDGVSTRVFIGPKLTKAALLEIKPKIDKAHTVNAMIVRYAPK